MSVDAVIARINEITGWDPEIGDRGMMKVVLDDCTLYYFSPDSKALILSAPLEKLPVEEALRKSRCLEIAKLNAGLAKLSLAHLTVHDDEVRLERVVSPQELDTDEPEYIFDDFLKDYDTLRTGSISPGRSPSGEMNPIEMMLQSF